MVNAYLCVGQSNMWGAADWRNNPSPPSGASLARLKHWMVDIMQFSDAVGAIVPLDFDASRMDVPTSAYDYPMSSGGPASSFGWNFGPDVYGGLALADHFGTDIQIVKLAPGGTFLTNAERVPGTDRSGNGSWCWLGAHQTWDTTLARSSAPYTTIVRDTGTATASTITSLTDPTKTWTTDQHKFRWITMGGAVGYCTGNSATVASVGFWVPNPLGPPPTPGAYTIDDRIVGSASLAKTALEGYCVAAQAAAGGGTANWDLDGIFMAIGESDAFFPTLAAEFRRNLLKLIWYFRTTAVSLGLTSRQAHQIKVVMSLIAEIPQWPHANVVNQAIRDIAEGDPYFEFVPINGVTFGGFTGVDPIHYDAPGQVLLGQRMGAAMVSLQSASGARKSIAYPGQHTVVRPVWSIGDPVHRRVSTFAELSAAAADQRRYPSVYLLRDAAAGSVPVYLLRDGRTISNGGDGTLLGWAPLTPRQGMVEIETLSIRDRGSRIAWGGARAGAPVRGWCWIAGCGDPSVFTEVDKTVGFHTIKWSPAAGGLPTRWRTTIPASSIDREWMLRGHRTNFGIAPVLQIDEKATSSILWMRHRLGHGDYRQAQVAGIGATFGPPLRGVTVSAAVAGSAVAVEENPDESSPLPSGLTVDQVNHGAVAALQHAVLWPDVQAATTFEIDWRGIVGCHRLVYEVTLPFAVQAIDDTQIEMPLWARNTFDKQFAYDPATTVETDLGWNSTDNRYHEVNTLLRATYNKNGTLFSTGASWFTRQAGVIGWQAAGSDQLVVALFVRLGPGRMRTPTLARLGNWTEPLAGADAGFADYDQRNYAYARVIFGGGGIAWPAGTVFRVAGFVLVGTMAQVKAAADQLYAIGADHTWTG